MAAQKAYVARLNEALEAKGWTQYRLAQELDVSKQVVNAWCRGKARPKLEAIVRISELLSMRLDQWL